MKTYIMSDLHGALTPFKKMLELIKFDINTDRLIVLGDVTDYGSESLELLLLLKSMNYKERYTIHKDFKNQVISVDCGAKMLSVGGRDYMYTKHSHIDKAILREEMSHAKLACLELTTMSEYYIESDLKS